MNLHEHDELRGHSLVPTPEEMRIIPNLYETEGTPNPLKTIVLRYFAGSGATWLISEVDPRSWLMFGYCDFGIGIAEWGYVDLHELAELRVAGPLGISVLAERDLSFTPRPFEDLTR